MYTEQNGTVFPTMLKEMHDQVMFCIYLFQMYFTDLHT